MGLDLIVNGCAKTGHEVEWRQFIQRAFSGAALSDAEVTRFQEISIPAYENMGAPRVGFDDAADAWIIKAQQAQTSEQIARTLKAFHGYYAVQLLECAGVPAYSNGGLYDGVDETSFRGMFLEDCRNVLSDELRAAAWENKFPEAAIDYGLALLDSAEAYEASQREQQSSLLPGSFKSNQSASSLPLQEELDIVRAAGRWFIFWGERGHPITAYF
jgi:hypothetical protein